ncbi:ribokinase [Galbibacter sp. BG1]|uniref:ribokinase n=1 Tax=Galbibacter sp. BG1 TaxID=1170699 RepID=UPI0015BB92B5|nr:ribokinase [Galbibacter sp. BG1]QLE01817.1 ribokinase [Galbibacter sp. BG1]
MGNRIVVIGSSNVDLIMKMDRLPKVGETITNAEFQQVFGGKGANQAVAAARAGGDVTFINCVGKNDPYHERMIQNFEEDSINTRYIHKMDNLVSGHALVMIGDDGKNYLSVAPGANYALTPKIIDKSILVIETASIILLQYEIPKETIKYVLEQAAEKNIPVMWNFAPAQEIDKRLFKSVHILVVNETEASYLSGITVEDIETSASAAKELNKLGPPIVIITLGEKGVIYFADHQVYHVPAYKVNAEDTTAAGDVFCGVFAVAYSEKKILKSAIKFACAAAALCVQKVGAQPSIPSLKEIEDLYRT